MKDEVINDLLKLILDIFKLILHKIDITFSKLLLEYEE